MGKAMGGGSSINATIWAHGHKNDYEYWAHEAGALSRDVRGSAKQNIVTRSG
jgi:hypothetical protein